VTFNVNVMSLAPHAPHPTLVASITNQPLDISSLAVFVGGLYYSDDAAGTIYLVRSY